MKSIVAWGADKTFEIAIKKHPLKIAYLVDNNPKKHGTYFLGLSVKSPAAIKNGERVIVFVLFFPEIKEQLETMGFVYKKDFFHFLDFPEYRGTIDEIVPDKDYHFLKKIIKPWMHCIDVGANCGFFTYKMSLLAGARGAVYSFEPLKHAYAQILRFKEIYNLNNITTFNVALSDKTGNIKMEIPFVNGRQISGLAHIKGEKRKAHPRFKNILKNYKETAVDIIETKVTTLDALFADIPRVNFIKIDVEGLEHRVLRGAQKIIAAHRPIIQCELFWGNDKKVISFLKEKGYKRYVLDGVEYISYFFPKETVVNEKELRAS